MGVFDGTEGSTYSDPFKSDSGKQAKSPEFSDSTSTGSSGTPPVTGKADFSDVTTGESSTAPAEPAAGTTYTVKSGDSLSKIAKHIYGDASKWHRIYEANRDKIKNPDLIHPGQEFTIPPDQK